MLLLLVLAAQFVGNKACSPCHSEIFHRYSNSPMAMTSGPQLPALTPGSFEHGASHVRYDIDAKGVVRLSKGTHREERQLSYYFGSGVAGRSFGYMRDGFLFEAPVTWYAQTGSWDVSPGYASDTVSNWSRPIEPSCLACHASQSLGKPGTLNGYADPAFAENGVSCERCHGPGSLHIAGKAKMVNPANLMPAQRDSVCAQCHLTGQARVTRAGRKPADYRPGDLLSDFAAVFIPADVGAFQVVSHVEKLAQSGCKKAAGDKLWCGSCHDPHGVPAAAEKASWFRAKCLNCHQTAECNRGFDCASCHMPKNNAVDAGHGVFTDHSIPRIAPSRAPSRAAVSSWKLRGFSAADSGDRELGMAYAEIGVRTGNVAEQAEARRLLSAAPPDAERDMRLADLEERAGNAAQAVALYRDVLRQDSNFVVPFVNLGRLYGLRGFLDEAIVLWRKALEHDPCLAEAGTNLQIALRAKNDLTAMEEVRRSQQFCVFQ